MLQTNAASLPTINSGKKLFRALLSAQFLPSSAWQKSAFRLKFFSRSYFYGTHLITQFLDELVQLPLWPQILHCQPGLPCKLHRPYLALQFNRQQTRQLLIEHYRLIQQLFSVQLQQHLFSGSLVELAQLAAKNETVYRLTIAPLDRLNKEGELTVQLFDQQQQRLAECSFTLLSLHGKRSLFIGGLQGAPADVEHQAIQEATKNCYGLFPKRLVLEAVCQFAQACAVEQILAVNKQNHIYQHGRYQRRKAALFRADYDEFWQSFSQQNSAEGYYQIPLEIPRKSLDEIASKKRAEYRRRYTLLDQLVAQSQQQLRN